MNFKKSLFLAWSFYLLASPMVLASDSGTNTKQATKTGDAPGNSTTQTATSSATLAGSVKSIDVEAAEALRQMGDCLKKIERASLELMGEATRQNYIGVGDPTVVGTIIIPAMPSETGVMAVGPYLPIRKQWFDYYMNQMASLFPIYADYVDALVMPDSTKSQAIALLDQMRQPFADAKARYMELYRYKKQLSKLGNKKVAVLSVQIHDDMGKMEKLRLQVFELLKATEKKE